MGVSQSVSRIKQKEVWIDYMRFYFMYRLTLLLPVLQNITEVVIHITRGP